MLKTVVPRQEVELELDTFREWLEARRSTIVGISCDDGSCPLSEYLTEQRHIRFYVGDEACGSYRDANFYSLPRWASAFIHRLDAVASYQEVPIVGEQALEVIEWVVVHGGIA